MRRTAFLMLGLACLLGGVSVYLAHDWLQGRAQSGAQALETTNVVVAKRPIRIGDPILPDLVKEVTWPIDARIDGTFSSIIELVGNDNERRVALRSMEPNEPVLKSRVSGFGGRATLSTQIPDGKRAFTIRTNDVVGVGGFVLPGDRVDVLLTREDDRRRPHNDIILQNIRVLGIDQDAAEDRNKPHVAKAVTLEVTAIEAQKIALAAKVGQISLALRNESNTDTVFADTLRLSDLSLSTGSSGFETASGPPVTESVSAPLVAPRPVSHSKPKKTANVTIYRAFKSSVVKVAREPAAPSQAAGASAKPAQDAGAPIDLTPSEVRSIDSGDDEPALDPASGDVEPSDAAAPLMVGRR